MHPSRRNADRLLAVLINRLVIENLTAKLHAGVEAIIHLEFKFEHEVAKLPLGAQKGIGRARHRAAHDLAALHRVTRLAASLHPAGEVPAVKNLDGGLRGERERQNPGGKGKKEEASEVHDGSGDVKGI